MIAASGGLKGSTLLAVSLEFRVSVNSDLTHRFNISGRRPESALGMISGNYTISDTMLPKYPTVHYSGSDWRLVALLTVGTVVLMAAVLVAAYLIYQAATVEVSEPSVISNTCGKWPRVAMKAASSLQWRRHSDCPTQ
jgi:hypothetical protein